MEGLQYIAVWPAVRDLTETEPNCIIHHGMAVAAD